jgi:Cys-rich four helix bundle protein (predicted Tat secretion target)
MEERREKDEHPVGRRDLVIAAGVLASVATARVALAAEHEKHSDREKHVYTEAKAYKKRAALAKATSACIATGQACLSHCMETFLSGDTTMAECALAVQEMLAVCGAMETLAANDSGRLPAMARACIAVCEHCEKECRVHEAHQPECKACADACAALVKEAKAVAA